MSSKKKKRFIKYFIVLVIIGGIAGFTLVHTSAIEKPKPIKTSSVGTSVTHTATPTVDLSAELSASWKEIMEDRDGDVDIAVYDEPLNQTAEYSNVSSTFYTASTVKLAILEELLLQDQKDGQTLSGEQLAEATPMIENSDNDDATDLWHFVGGDSAMNSFFQEIGATSTTAGEDGYWGLTETTAQDELKVVNTLAYPGKLLTDSSVSEANDLLNNVEADQRWGVSGGVPSGVSIQLKDGWLPDSQTTPLTDKYQDTDDWLTNSIGYVHGDGQNYTIAVYTDGDPSEQYGITTIEDLSQATWKDLTDLTKAS